MPKKKVLFFCGGNKVFGAEIVTLSVLKEMKESGYDILCISNGWNDGHFHKRLEKLGIPYIPVKLGMFYLSRLWWTLDTLIHLPKALYSIGKIIRKFNPDVIFHVSYGSLLVTYPFLKNRKNIFLIFDPYYGKLKKQYFKWLNQYVQTYVAVSDAIKSNLVNIGVLPEKILVFKNGINTDSSVRLKAPGDIIHFGIVGQIVPRKGHADVIEALKMLKFKNIEFKCVIIGSGNNDFINQLKEKIKEYQLQDHVIWRDFIENRDEIYQLFHVILIPSTTLDPLPTTAMEAGLYYKPAIVTNMGGLPEIVIDQVTGFVIEPNNPLELAQKMEILIDPKTIHEIGKAAHIHIIEQFDIKSQIELVYNLIDS